MSDVGRRGEVLVGYVLWLWGIQGTVYCYCTAGVVGGGGGLYNVYV